MPLPALAGKARENGLWISEGANYGVDLNAVRLGFGSVNEAEMEQGMAILRRSLP